MVSSKKDKTSTTTKTTLVTRPPSRSGQTQQSQVS